MGMSRAQTAVYAILGVVLLLLGVGAVRGDSSEGGPGGRDGVRLASEPVGSEAPGAGSGDAVVHVAGAVRKPGVYRLPLGARVADAVERAGGAGTGATVDAINLAARLTDGQQVVVPSAAPAASGVEEVAAGEAAPGEGPIPLGSATAADLEEIDGIGPVTAEKIVSFRDERGGLGSVTELDEISGIGPATLEALSERLQP